VTSEFEQIRRECLDWIREAGVIARDRMAGAVASRKADQSLVTDADQAVQDFLMDRIAREFPGDAVISEETQADPARHASVAAARRCWIIDPIDGTRNYVRRVPMFSVSVALCLEGSPMVGWVYNPMNDQMYSGARGCGARLNEDRISAEDKPAVGDLFIGLPSGREESLPRVVHGWIDRMVQRATGSTALNLVLLASGCLDAVFGTKCKLWDIAAGAIILAEAGARLTDHQGHPWFPTDLAAYRGTPTPFLAASPALLEQLMAELAAGKPARD
jgi:myo-inositol-1(or 4)-monophosphatase